MTPPARLAQVQAHLASPTSSPLAGAAPPPARSASSSAAAATSAKPVRPRAPTASEFRYFLPMQTRWNDNDSYGHMNNAIYAHYFDSVTNAYLLHHAYPSPPTPRPIGLIVNSATTYAASVAYPQPVVAALAVSQLGTRSVTWRVALFAGEYVDPAQEEGTAAGAGAGAGERLSAAALSGFTLDDVQSTRVGAGRRVRLVRPAAGDGDDEPRAAAYGEMVHVFVDEESRRPVKELDDGMRAALQRLVVA
ncbi:hypothetical protein JCM8208_007269 [Rhodotorula glutinis]